MKNSKGFTLVELLVVVAIIGVMSSIVVASLNNSRIKANDARIKTQLSNIRTAAEIYYSDNNNTYGGTAVVGTEAIGLSIGTGCASGMFTDSKISPLVLLANFPSYSNAGKCTIPAGGGSYVVSAKLNAANSYWCVDSKGASGPEVALQGDSAATCP